MRVRETRLVPGDVPIVVPAARNRVYNNRVIPLILDSRMSNSSQAAPSVPNGLAQRVLVVEDLEDTRASLQELLQLSLGLEVDTAEDGAKALAMLRERPYSLVITDLRMPKVSGMKLIETIQNERIPVTVIVTTGHGSIKDAVEAMRLGAFDFLTKPPDPQHLCLLVKRALENALSAGRGRGSAAELQGRHSFQNVLSKSPRMHDVFELVGQIADTTSTVLIRGETGTGQGAGRAGDPPGVRSHRPGPFVAVNCGALNENLLESELFGHEKGSYTGADRKRVGRFELAHQGTLFPRRDRRRAAVDADQAAPRAPGAALRAGRRDRTDRGRRAGHRRHAPGHGEARQGREVPRGPLLPAERRPDRYSAAARTARGHPGTRRAFLPEVRPTRSAAAHRQSGSDGRAAEVPVAGERPATGERDRAGLRHRPRRRHYPPRTCPPDVDRGRVGRESSTRSRSISRGHCRTNWPRSPPSSRSATFARRSGELADTSASAPTSPASRGEASPTRSPSTASRRKSSRRSDLRDERPPISTVANSAGKARVPGCLRGSPGVNRSVAISPAASTNFGTPSRTLRSPPRWRCR